MVAAQLTVLEAVVMCHVRSMAVICSAWVGDIGIVVLRFVSQVLVTFLAKAEKL